MIGKIDDLLKTEFIQKITGSVAYSVTERKLLTLPLKMGGLGILKFNEILDLEYNNSTLLTELL